MAAYGRGPYGEGNYSFGVSLGAAPFQGTSTATADGVRFTFGAAQITAESSVSIDATRVAFMSAAVASDSIITVDSNVVVNQGVNFNALSAAFASGIRVRQSAAPFLSNSNMTILGRLKWEPEIDTPEVWTPVPDIAEIWTSV